MIDMTDMILIVRHAGPRASPRAQVERAGLLPLQPAPANCSSGAAPQTALCFV